MSTSVTRLPAWSSCVATARPSPRAAPVTTAVRGSSGIGRSGQMFGLGRADIGVEPLGDETRIFVDVPGALRVLAVRVRRRLDDPPRVAVLLDRLLLPEHAAVRAVQA